MRCSSIAVLECMPVMCISIFSNPPARTTTTSWVFAAGQSNAILRIPIGRHNHHRQQYPYTPMNQDTRTVMRPGGGHEDIQSSIALSCIIQLVFRTFRTSALYPSNPSPSFETLTHSLLRALASSMKSSHDPSSGKEDLSTPPAHRLHDNFPKADF